jgi:hypothetical protein
MRRGHSVRVGLRALHSPPHMPPHTAMRQIGIFRRVVFHNGDSTRPCRRCWHAAGSHTNCGSFPAHAAPRAQWTSSHHALVAASAPHHRQLITRARMGVHVAQVHRCRGERLVIFSFCFAFSNRCLFENRLFKQASLAGSNKRNHRPLHYQPPPHSSTAFTNLLPIFRQSSPPSPPCLPSLLF